MANTTRKLGYQTSVGEKVGYGTYFLGQNIFYTIISSYYVVFCTDLGIKAAAVAVLALLVKVWDAVNDPIFGGIVDKVHLKAGKFIPWLRISLIFIPLATIFMFACQPSLSMSSKIGWMAIAYILWDTAYTLCDVPIFGIVTTMTSNQNERTMLMSTGRICAGVGSFLGAVVIPLVRQWMGGWLPTVIMLSILSLIFMFPLMLTAKERVHTSPQLPQLPQLAEDKISFRDMGHFLAHNKFMMLYLVFLILGNALFISNPLGMYMARYNLGNEQLLTLYTFIQYALALVTLLLIPLICRRINKYTLYFWSSVGMVVTGVIAWLAGYHSMVAVFLTQALRGLPFGFTAGLMFMFTPDCVEYGAYKTKVKASGIAFSLQTFSEKLAVAIASSLSGVLLAAIGFVSGEGAVQPADFNDKLWAIFNLLPAAGYLLSLPVLAFYKLRDRDVQVMADCNIGKITREEAEARLSRKY
jgi:sugar (glycoside-pentoside-hexuronide) transporter